MEKIGFAVTELSDVISFDTKGFSIGDKVEFRPHEGRRKILNGVITSFEMEMRFTLNRDGLSHNYPYVIMYIRTDEDGVVNHYTKAVTQPSVKKLD